MAGINEDGGIRQHLLQRGWQEQAYSDVTIQCFGQRYRLHSLIIDQAHYFRSLLGVHWRHNEDAGSEAGDAWFFCGTLEDILSSVFPQIFLASCEGFRATAKMCPVLNGDARPSDYLPLI